MYTVEQWGASSPPNGFTSFEACKVAPGWGVVSETTVEPCQVGFYNAGQNRLPCTACPEGWTTLGNASTSASDCNVLQPGFYRDANTSQVLPCPHGYFSSGSTTSCTQCPAGYTTADTESASADDCSGESATICLAHDSCMQETAGKGVVTNQAALFCLYVDANVDKSLKDIN